MAVEFTKVAQDEDSEAAFVDEGGDAVAEAGEARAAAAAPGLGFVRKVGVVMVLLLAAYGLYEAVTGCRSTVCLSGSEFARWVNREVQKRVAGQEELVSELEAELVEEDEALAELSAESSEARAKDSGLEQELAEAEQELNEAEEEVEEAVAGAEDAAQAAKQDESMASAGAEASAEAEAEAEEADEEAEQEQLSARPELALQSMQAWERPDRFTSAATAPAALALRAAVGAGAAGKVLINLGLPKTGAAELHVALSKLARKQLEPSLVLCYPSDHANHSRFGDLSAMFKSASKAKEGRCTDDTRKCAYRMSVALADRAAGRRPLDFVSGRAFSRFDCVDKNYAFLPQVTALRDMLNAYAPDEVVFVMTSRTDEAWVEAVSRNGLAKQLPKVLAGLYFEDHRFPAIAAQDSPAQLARWLRDLKQWHEARVRALVQQAGHTLVPIASESDVRPLLLDRIGLDLGDM
jgi:hypothetical protein